MDARFIPPGEMTAPAIAAALTEALESAAAGEGGESARLISMQWELLEAPAPGEARVRVTRKTRTLIFLSADYADAGGTRIAAASSVYRLA